MRLAEVMTHEVLTVPPGVSLKDAARLLVEHRISGLPVVDDDRRVLGVVSETDLLVKEIGGDESRLVGEAMSSPALTIDAGVPVAAAARLMLAKSVNRLPVVESGRLIGIITRADLVRAFVRSDAEIASEIRDDIVVRRLQLDRRDVHVEVEDGEVTLSGRLTDRADRDLLQALVAEVPGVVAVNSKLSWTDGDDQC